jgi:hypothetical protein
LAELQPSSDDLISNPSFIRIEDLLATPADSSEQQDARDGLPRSFRMRADRHYVEMLDAAPGPGLQLLDVSAIAPGDGEAAAAVPALATSIALHGVLQPLLVQGRPGRYRLIAGRKRLAAAIAAGLRQVPCIVRPVDDAAEAVSMATNVFGEERAAHADDGRTELAALAGRMLADSLIGLDACAKLLGGPVPVLGSTISSLVRAEVSRVSWLVQAARVLRREASGARRAVSAQALLDRVVQALEPERELRGAVLEQRTDLRTQLIDVDEELFTSVLCGLLAATLALTDGRRGIHIILSGESQPGGDVTIGISQDAVSAPLEWLVHASGDGAIAWQSGGAATVAISAARHVTDDCGGRLTVSAGPQGTAVQLSIPRIA